MSTIKARAARKSVVLALFLFVAIVTWNYMGSDK